MKRFFVFALPLLLLYGCAYPKNEVVVYTSVDQVFSEPILQDFEKKSGIKVKAIYDVEAAKTTGLVNRLIAEKNHPQADVFWNSEIARTIILKNKGVLEPYVSAQSASIPEQFKDKQGYWTGFAARARIFICNTHLLSVEKMPRSIFDLTLPALNGRVVLAKPIFGTTATFAASLFVALGDQRAEKFFRDLKANNVIIVEGNATVRDRVQEGEFPIGLTDTDDANVALENKKPVAVIYSDQGKNGIGALLIPNTVSLIKNAPNQANGKKLIDYLLSEEIESRLAFSSAAQIPLRDHVKRPASVPSYRQIKAMDVDFEKVANAIERATKVLEDIFIR